jgi:NAD(P) transhydrogenase subunit alpha
VLKIAPLAQHPILNQHEAQLARANAIVATFVFAHENAAIVQKLAEREVTLLAMERVPRITRAQKLDALSSQANIAGYKAVLIAASHLPRYFPLFMTAAGTIPAAKVVVMGAGVAGLQALATARRLGAVVWVSDIRPAVKEQVESLGGKFIDLPVTGVEDKGGYAKELSQDALAKQQAIIGEHVATADVVITTAQIPGRPAPRLVSADMVHRMRKGSVVIDLAAAAGGNCELTQADQELNVNGVTVLGPTNLAASVAYDASVVYSRNIAELVFLIVNDGKLLIDPKDEVVGAMLLAHAGALMNAAPKA